MMKSKALVFAAIGLISLGACKGDDAAVEDGTVVDTDTAVVQGMDTVNMPVAVPTTDTVVSQTTVDTVHGTGVDTAHTPGAGH